MRLLKPANLEDADQEYEALQWLAPHENGFETPCHGMTREAFMQDGLASLLHMARGVGLPAGYVPQTCYFLWDGEEIVGLFKVRPVLNEALRMGAGHVGYAILPEYRGKGYATEGLRLAVELLLPDIEEAEVYLSCESGNEASLRVQQKNGAYIHHADAGYRYTRIPLDPKALRAARCAGARPLCRAVREQTRRALWEVQNVLCCIPDALWEKTYCDQPLWKHAYHMLHSLDRWLENPCDGGFVEPPFHKPGLNDLDAPVRGAISRTQLEAYRAQVCRKSEDYLASLTDEILSERPTGCGHTRFTLILAQHRHLHTHMGMLMGFIVAETGLWPRVLGLEGEFPRGDFDRYM
ncbi:GNAT family N-acetyltransferase [Beduinella massiliensis]|uniref:GNAT family N-acetyltransferase n=1 Tax=Beduinella massiliensis TaxID=1852363 RepID=UPI0031F88AF7